MKKRIVLFAVILALVLSAAAVIRIVRFSAINESDYPVTAKMTYVSDKDGKLTPYDFVYLSLPPDGETYTYTVVKTPYYFEWWGGEGVCLKPTIGLTYESDGLVLKPVVSTLLRFKQCWNMPGWYLDWLERWKLEVWEDAYIYH